jgi:hypothetical protein
MPGAMVSGAFTVISQVTTYTLLLSFQVVLVLMSPHIALVLLWVLSFLHELTLKAAISAVASINKRVLFLNIDFMLVGFIGYCFWFLNETGR